MSDALDEAMAAAAGSEVVEKTGGRTAGLNASSSKERKSAKIWLTSGSIVVGFEAGMFKPKPVVEVFALGEIIDVIESDVPITGVEGTIARKNATHAVGRAMGQSGTTPGVTLSTRRGDLVVACADAGAARRLSVALSDLLATR